jgi:imidazolonepropionase-like amidohydrolase
MNEWARHLRSILIGVLTTVLIVPAGAAEQSGASPEQSQRVVAIKAGIIIPVTSPQIENGVVLIRGGKIEAVGKEVEIPQGAEIIDATDKVVIPGLIDAFTTLAEKARDDEESVTPAIRAKDAFDFFADYRRMLAGGVTTVYISPGQRRLISGLGAVVKLAGDSVSERVLTDAAALRITLGELPKSPPEIFKPPIPPGPNAPILPVEKQLPTTRMAELALLRQLFTQAKQYQKQRPGQTDPKLEALLPALDAKLPVRINCQTAQDIGSAIRLAQEFNLRLVLEGATEAYKVVDEVKECGAPAVISGVIEPGQLQTKDYDRDVALGRVNPANAAILAKAGVKFALAAATDQTVADLAFIAGYAVNQGLSPQAALAAITITPAEILGVAERVGSIEKGKDADLVILTGEPFNLESVVDRTFINGKIVYTRPAEESKKPAPEEPVVAIRAGKIFTASRGQINDGLILIKGSKIAYVGQPKPISQQARVIDAGKSVVIPGLIDIHSHLGLHWESEPIRLEPSAPTAGPDSPALRLVSIANAIDPNDPAFREVLSCGVTAVLLAPQTRGLVSGNAALIKLAGDTIGQMIVKEYAAIEFSMLGETARPARIWEARDLLKQAKEYAQKWDDYEAKRTEYEHRKPTDKESTVKEPDRPSRDVNLEPLRGLFKREMPALVQADRADEIRAALKVFRDEYNLDIVILGGQDSYRIVPELKKYDVGVAVGPNVLIYEKGKPINNADLLSRQGLRVALHSSASSAAQYLLMNAAYAVRYGMDEDEAFRAITSHPAELLHLEDRIGSIDVGKDADLVILSGEPFGFASRVEKVLVNGRVVFERQE